LSRPHRLDFHGAIHLVQLRGKKGFSIYFDASVLARPGVERGRSAPHLLHFCSLMDMCSAECGALLFGYCVEPNSASLAIRTVSAPLDAFMQRLGGRYSRYLHAAGVLPKHVGAFATRYESKVVAPEYLPHAVRRVHAQALLAGLARRAIDYPFSSAAAYVGERALVRLETDVVWRGLALKGLFGLRGYREFMEKAETPHVTKLFEQGSPLDARVVGGPAFVTRAHDAARHQSAPLTRQQLIEGVAQLLGSGPQVFLGRGHQAVLARALVAWHTLRSGTASVREVGTWFGVTAATVGRGIRHYRRVSPEWFERALPGTEPRNDMLED
jgi:hypothetical protein